MKKIYSEQKAEEYADEVSQSVVIRSFVDGNSSDDRRESTDEEKWLLKTAIYAALLAIREGRDEESAKAAAEYFIAVNQPAANRTRINTYDSVYEPIGVFLTKR
jgi:hypothetical protein